MFNIGDQVYILNGVYDVRTGTVTSIDNKGCHVEYIDETENFATNYFYNCCNEIVKTKNEARHALIEYQSFLSSTIEKLETLGD